MTDGMDNVTALLNSDWNIVSGGKKPTIALVETFKRIDLGGDQDVIVVYGGAGNVTPVSLGYGSERQIQPISIDIRTTTSKTRLLVLLEEVKRIIHVNRRKAVNGIHDLIVYKNETPLNNKTIKLFRYIVEAEIRDYAKPVP